MKLHDQHMHSRYSVDSEADPEASCRQALQVGLSGVTFTEHYDRHPDEWDICIWDHDRIAASVTALRQRFAGQLTIGLGIEVCYQPVAMEQILAELAAHAFDVVLLSVHWCGGRPLHVASAWDGLGPDDMIGSYLETVLEAVTWCRDLRASGPCPFDVLGHMDLAKRYTQRYWGGGDLSGYGALVDAIFQQLLAAGMVPELNTSTLRQGVDEPMPANWMIERYAAQGGRAVSLGSDAHRSQDVGADFASVAAQLQAAGVEAEAVFEQRRPRLLPLL